ncbi:hypothetical protein FIBSPDRAFT_751561 [Athelia psychrophila]|nr:hypothetical protein FIBSPDRAFT_751561 [Fibularhizoctonia sp. CBS 109695]
MQYLIPLLALGATTANAYADIAKFVEAQRLASRASIVPFPPIGGIPRLNGTVPFDASAQLVSVSGNHAWIAPGPTDQRGPCPGLNAAANHNYLPRDGIATFPTVQTGLFEAYGLDQSATEVLQQTTTFFDGDPVTQSWSIGGYSPKTAALGGALDFLGQESGICGYGHLKSEGDASITRGDFTSPGNMNSNCASYPVFFQQLLDLACETNGCNINMATLAAHQNNRKLYSIANNPTYFSPAFAGVAFTPAAHHFVYALMANHSAEYPQGILTPETLMSFFSYTYESDGKTLSYTYGHERIPDNWYKRALTDSWTLADILAAVAQQCLAYPNTCEVGGNTGTVNSFAGIDVGDLSGGVFNASVFTDPAQLGCFLAQNIQAEAPSFLSNVLQGPLLPQVLGLVTSSLVPTLAKGFGECNGINVKGGNMGNTSAVKTLGDYSAKYPGAAVVYDGARATSPNP